MDDAEETARDALYARLEKLAGDDLGGTPEQRSVVLVKLSEAYRNLRYGDHGLQGGVLRQHDTEEVDYHYTTHQGEDRQRPPAGFGGTHDDHH